MTDDLRSWGESNTPLPDHETALAEVLSLRYRIATQQEAIDELVAGLRPFAELVEYIGADESDDAWAKFRLIVKNYRDAAALLSKRGERT